jgi:hypothetical protein
MAQPSFAKCRSFTLWRHIKMLYFQSPHYVTHTVLSIGALPTDSLHKASISREMLHF